MSDADGTSKQSFWTTFPGIATGVAALITAITGLIVGLVQAGFFDGGQDRADAPAVVAEEPSSSPRTPVEPAPPTATPVPTPGPMWADIGGRWNFQVPYGSPLPADFTFVETRGEVDVYEYGQVDPNGRRIVREARVQGNVARIPDPSFVGPGTFDFDIADADNEMSWPWVDEFGQPVPDPSGQPWIARFTRP